MARIVFGTNCYSYELGFYATNWDYPLGYKWEIGVNLVKWQIGLELYR